MKRIVIVLAVSLFCIGAAIFPSKQVAAQTPTACFRLVGQSGWGFRTSSDIFTSDLRGPYSTLAACNAARNAYIASLSPTSTPTPTNTPRPRPTNTPRPRPTDTPTPTATNTPMPQDQGQGDQGQGQGDQGQGGQVQRPTNTPMPTNTLMPGPTNTSMPTNTPMPRLTHTPRPEPTYTPMPAHTPKPKPARPHTTHCLVKHAATPAQLCAYGEGLQYYFVGPGGVEEGPYLPAVNDLAELHSAAMAAVEVYRGVNPLTGKPVQIDYLPNEQVIRVFTYYADTPYSMNKPYIFTLDRGGEVTILAW